MIFLADMLPIIENLIPHLSILPTIELSVTSYIFVYFSCIYLVIDTELTGVYVLPLFVSIRPLYVACIVTVI